MKPIEPGCKAMIVMSFNFPELVGTILNVSDSAGNRAFMVLSTGETDLLPCWHTDHPMCDGVWAERCLMRIDEDAQLSPVVTHQSEVL